MDSHRDQLGGGASLRRTVADSHHPHHHHHHHQQQHQFTATLTKKLAAAAVTIGPPDAASPFSLKSVTDAHSPIILTDEANNNNDELLLPRTMSLGGAAKRAINGNDAGADNRARDEATTTGLASREQTKKIPLIEQVTSYEPAKAAVPRTRPPRPTPALDGRPIVLATHLVPSLPVDLFEVVAEAIEAVTAKPVVLLHESRTDRPVAKDVVDIAILPAGETWEDGDLLPVSFVFEHRLNKTFSPAIYADVVVATDRAPHVEGIMDLRGHRCAFPDRKRALGAANLLFSHLRAKGEGPAFFGNTLDANSQVSALQMVAGKQVEVCILESPVIRFHRKSLPGVYSLHILTSLGPLPPYAIMTNKNMSNEVVNKIKDYLLNIKHYSEWIEKFAPYSVLGFAEYSKHNFDVQEIKSVATSAPYY